MNPKALLFATIVATITAYSSAAPVDYTNEQKNNNNSNNNGKYQFSNSKAYQNNANELGDGKYHAYGRADDGKYHPPSNKDGHYMHMTYPYRHVHDNRELGKYVHIPYPYDGGYGPYAGMNLPYKHVDVPYDHNLYTSTTTKKPTTRRTTTTTTTTPRAILFNYDDEGRYRILHQEEIRKEDKYDHAYLTENGIYGEEQANLHKDGGTHAMGYYEYTGDDGKLYRVNYKSNRDGFIPTAEHIPTPPPIPEAIARALKYVEEKRKANGESPRFDQRGFRIEDMPREMWTELRRIQHEMEEAEKVEPFMKQAQEAYTTEATTEQYLKG